MKHPTFPPGLPSRDGSDGKKGKTRVRAYTDRGDGGVIMCPPPPDKYLF